MSIDRSLAASFDRDLTSRHVDHGTSTITASSLSQIDRSR